MKIQTMRRLGFWFLVLIFLSWAGCWVNMMASI